MNAPLWHDLAMSAAITLAALAAIRYLVATYED